MHVYNARKRNAFKMKNSVELQCFKIFYFKPDLNKCVTLVCLYMVWFIIIMNRYILSF